MSCIYHPFVTHLVFFFFLDLFFSLSFLLCRFFFSHYCNNHKQFYVSVLLLLFVQTLSFSRLGTPQAFFIFLVSCCFLPPLPSPPPSSQARNSFPLVTSSSLLRIIGWYHCTRHFSAFFTALLRQLFIFNFKCLILSFLFVFTSGIWNNSYCLEIRQHCAERLGQRPKTTRAAVDYKDTELLVCVCFNDY